MRPANQPREGRLFNAAEVLEIRRRVRKLRQSQASVAREFGCSVDTIYGIVTRMTYKEVDADFYWPEGREWLMERMAANAEAKRRARAKGRGW